MEPPRPAILALARQAAVRAGHSAMTFFRRSTLDVQAKADASPVTAADLEADRIIRADLEAGSPWPVVSEESGAAPTDADSPFWLVDPIDGTRDFVAGEPEFTVNIAFVAAGRPVAGVIYAPALGVCYWGEKGSGGFWQRDGDEKPRPLRSRSWDPGAAAFLVSRRFDRAREARIRGEWPQAIVRPVSSSLKFCLLAAGEADVYFRSGASSTWDTAAGQAILEAAGGRVYVAGGESLTVPPGVTRNPAFLAVGDAQPAPAAWWSALQR